MSDKRPKTIFLDIDGTILYHHGSLHNILLSKPRILDGVLDKLDQWNMLGYNIILTTGRPESMRSFTEKQLELLGISYNQLIMNIGGGCRFIINDDKPHCPVTAVAIVVKRNQGLKDINI